MRKSATTAVAAAALIACQGAAAEPTASVEYRDAFTTKKPGAPSGRVFHDEFFNAGDRSGKPPPVQHIHIQLPHGARFDWRAVPLCTASDAELTAEAPSACPAGSKVGAEVYSFDTGVDGPNRIVTSDITFLNNKEELIIVTRERQSGTRVVTRGKLGPETFDFDLPPLPGTPPDGGADKLEDANYPIRSGRAGRRGSRRRARARAAGSGHSARTTRFATARRSHVPASRRASDRAPSAGRREPCAKGPAGHVDYPGQKGDRELPGTV